jgi:hypothetical protein
MPLTKAEATQLKNSVTGLQGPIVNGGGVRVSLKDVLRAIDLFTEETINDINEGRKTFRFVDSNENQD